MKNLKKKFRFRINLKSKHLLAIMTLFCLSCIVATFASGISTAPLQETAGIVIVPFEKSIEKIGSMVRSIRDSFKDKQDLLFENEELKAELDSLTTQNNKLIQDQGEYQRLKNFTIWIRPMRTIRRWLRLSFPKILETGTIPL